MRVVCTDIRRHCQLFTKIALACCPISLLPFVPRFKSWSSSEISNAPSRAIQPTSEGQPIIVFYGMLLSWLHSIREVLLSLASIGAQQKWHCLDIIYQ